MNIELTLNETRLLGCLMEKSVLTPDVYPLTLNALTLACNQKSSREPVLSLDPGTVEHCARQLEAKHFVSVDENAKGRTRRYTQRFCNTPFGEFQFSREEFAVICLLLLRGPQTPGELRARSGRLCSFADNRAATTTLQGLIDRADGPLVVQLAKLSGRQDSQYAHLFSGTVAPRRHLGAAQSKVEAEPIGSDRISQLESRIETLEAELQEIRQILALDSDAAADDGGSRP